MLVGLKKRSYRHGQEARKARPWQFPFAAFAGFGSVEEEPSQAAEAADRGSFLASLTVPFAAFAGFGSSEAALEAPAPAPKAMGWQPWATYAAAAEEDISKKPRKGHEKASLWHFESYFHHCSTIFAWLASVYMRPGACKASRAYSAAFKTSSQPLGRLHCPKTWP